MQSCVAFILKTLKDEIDLFDGLGSELRMAKDELELMKDFLQGADLVVESYPNSTTYLGQIRDRAYDIEDILDEYRLNCACHRLSGMRLKRDHQIANRISDIRKRIEAISRIHGTYQTQFQGPEPGASLTNEVHGDALLLREDEVIGINKQKEGLKSKLLSPLSQRNVISVIGMGGLGKTTLVRKVYDDLNVTNRFTYRAWITVTKSALLKELLKDAIRQLCPKEERQSDQELDGMRIQELRDIILVYLQDKQYFVVFDDVWEQPQWNEITVAFPRNNTGSRIVITTRNRQLGRTASSTESGGSVTQLGHLQYDAARKLLCRKAFQGAASCPPELEAIFEMILKACQNLPLAIVVIGSILATKSTRGEWEEFYGSLGTQLEQNNELETLKKLLFHSYYALPSHLRTCLVYLSIFPENALIKKRRILLLWISEGFIEETDDMTIEEVAESYLNKLIDRSLVQIGDSSIDGRVETIYIHSIIQRLILLKAREQNSTTIFHAKVKSSFKHNARRLAFQASIDDKTTKEQAASSCKYLRSLILFQSHGGNILEETLSDLLSRGKRLVKVLDMEGAPLEVIPDEIFKLLLLKYLCPRSTKVKSIPKSIRLLQNLETLDLIDTDVIKLPKEILELQQLRHLLVYRYVLGPVHFHRIQGFRALCKIGNLKSLQNLYYIEADKVDANTKIVNEIDLLTLRTLKLSGPLEQIPYWVSSLEGITTISLRFSRLEYDPLIYLQNLLNLMSLELDSAYDGKLLWFKSKFPKLRNLGLFRMRNLTSVRVGKDAMQVLEGLTMTACKSLMNIPTGTQHLGRLKEISFSDMSDEFVEEIKSVNRESLAFKRIVHVPRVLVDISKGGKHHILHLDRETGKFK